MGSNYYVYVGPYVKCSVDRIVPKRKIRTCSSDICDLVRSRREFGEHQRFCEKCGSPVTNIEIDDSERDAISSWLIGDETQERFCSFNREYATAGIQIFIPNQDYPRPFLIEKGDDLTGEILLVSGGLIEKERAWLQRHFAADMEKFKTIYGADRIEILWGVMGQYM